VDAGASLLVTVPATLEVAAAAAEGTPVMATAVMGPAEGVDSLDEWYGEPLAEQVPVSGETVVALPYSSGTTGLSKGALSPWFDGPRALSARMATRAGSTADVTYRCPVSGRQITRASDRSGPKMRLFTAAVSSRDCRPERVHAICS
jgi:acyl-coenzyme A synthetase/AMP-(fatty) acid ligase